MSDGSVKIDVLLDDDSAVKSINKMETAFKKASDQFSKIDDTKMSNVVSLSKDASDELKKVETATNKFGDELQQIDDSKLKDVVNTSDKASTSIKGIVTSLGLVKIATAAFNVLKGSLDSAIARFDTMNQFPRVLEKMGFSAEQSERAIRKLSNGIQGLPTTLDGIASVAQRIASMSGDLAQASDVALALNNAFLASGASAEQASSGMEQYIQMLSTGQADMQSWKILEETMKYALDETARSFLGATANSRGLYAALQSGEITFDQFGNKLIELSTATGGFAETALESSKGLQTSFQNIGTAVVSGIERIIRKTNDLVKNITGKEIYEHLDTFKSVVSTAFLSIGRSIDKMTPFVKGIATVFGTLINVAKKLDFAIIGLAASFGAYKTLVTVSNNLAKLRVAFSILTVVKTNATLATKLYTAEQIRAATSSKVAATAIALLTGKISLMSLATSAATTAMTFLKTPVGWAAVAIGALAGAGFLAYKHFSKLSPEMLKFAEDSKDAAQASQQLADRVDDSAASFTNRMSEIDGQTDSLRKLIEQTVDLSNKENLTAGDKKILKTNVDDLNSSVTGLSLAYDDETESLNMSAEAMKTRLNLMDQEQRFNAARERGIEIEKEKADIILQQQVNAELLARAQKEIEETGFLQQNSKVHDEVVNLKEANKDLSKSYEELGEIAEITARIEEESAMQAAIAQQEATALGISSIKDLEGAQRSLAENAQSAYAEYAQIATDMFDKLATTSEIGVGTMIENLEHNQQALRDYASNIEAIEQAVGDLDPSGEFLNTLREMGPEAAGEVSNIANSIGTGDFATLVETFTSGGEEAKSAFFKSLSFEESEFIDGFGDVITTLETSLAEQLENSDLKKKVTEAMTGDSESIAAAGKEVGTQMAGGIGGAAPEFEIAGGALADSTATGFTNNQSAVVEAAQGMMTEVELATTTGSENMQTTMESGMETLKSVIEIGFKAVLEAITSSLNQAVSVSQDTSSKVVANLNTAVSGATQAGRDTGAGFRIGLEGQRSSIMATAGSIASDAVRAMKAALDSKSPSKKTIAVGEDTGEGYVIGMENLFGKVRQAAGKLASLAITGVGMTSQSLGMGSLSHGLAESALPRFDMNALFSQSRTQAPNTINNSTNNTTQVTKVDNRETNALLRLIADKNVTINIDGQRLADQLTPHISSIMGNNITDIRRGW